MTLDQFHDLKIWHQRHWRDQPLEKHVWDVVLTLWVAGWVGAPTAILVHAGWALAGCAFLYFLPGAYVRARFGLARAGVVRCDWLPVVAGRR